MFNPKEKVFLKKQLASYCTNYIQLILKETKLSRPTVSKFFNDKEVSPAAQLLIFEAAKKIISSKVEQAKCLVDDIQKITGNTLETN